jgi:hypothetical protein
MQASFFKEDHQYEFEGNRTLENALLIIVKYLIKTCNRTSPDKSNILLCRGSA